MGYFSIEGNFENTNIIERSKFICYIKGIVDEDDAKSFILSIKKLNSMATHNCYAYIADDKGLIQKFSDDGEPQGTAGLPMLEVLKNKKLYKTVAVVTRYFGGIKLGTGGLTRAYAGAVNDCLNICKINHYMPATFYELDVDYNQYSTMLSLLTEGVAVINSNFDNFVSIELAVSDNINESFIKKANDVFSGSLKFSVKGKGYYPF